MRSKRIFSLALALLLVCTMAAPAFAAEAIDDTVPCGEGYDYAQPPLTLMVDGVFAGAEVTLKNVGGRTMADFKQLVTLAGGKVLSSESGALMAELNDRKVTMSVNSKRIDILYSGASGSVEMDVQPFPAEDKLFVPVRALYEALGLSVGWNWFDNTVVVINYYKLGARVDAEYTAVNRLLRIGFDAMKTYSIVESGDINLKADLGKDIGKFDAQMTYKGSSLVNKFAISSESQMTVKANLDGLKAEDSYDQAAIDRIKLMLNDLTNIQFKLIYDLDGGKFYMNFGEFSTFMSGMGLMPGVDKDTWVKFEYSDYDYYTPEFTLAVMTGDRSGVTLGNLIAAMGSSDYASISTYDELCFSLAVMDGLLSDKAIKISGSESVPTYEINIDGAKIVAAVTAAAIKHPEATVSAFGDMEFADISKMFGLNFKYVITLRSDHDYSAKLDLGFDMSTEQFKAYYGEDYELYFDEGDRLDINLSANVDQVFPGRSTTKFMLTVGVSDEYFTLDGTLAANQTVDVAVTDRSVPKAPPAGAKIVDMDELFDSYYGYYDYIPAEPAE